MKLVRFEYKGKVLYGVVRGQEISGMDGSIFDKYEENEKRYPLSDVKLLPPVMPSKIVCIGQNYLEHIKEIGGTPPKVPLYFLKPPSSLIGPDDHIVYPKMATRVDYEGELAIVIKTKMKDVVNQDVKNYVLGYSCFNDVTERDLVAKDPLNLTLSKGFDTFGAFGPCIETDVDPDHLELKTYLNGRLMQEDNSGNCLFTLQVLLEYLSQCLTLYPGDIVTTGTPKGVSPMKPGDLVEVEIEGIGRLSNKVVAA